MSVRSRSRSPVRRIIDYHYDDQQRYLFIGNLPKEWRFYHIKEFLVEHYLTDLDVIEDMGHLFILRDSTHQPKGDCVLAFDTVECCQKAVKALQGAECEGKKLVVMSDTGKILPVNSRPRPVKPRRVQEVQKPLFNPFKVKLNHGPQLAENKESKIPRTFGLSREFLDSLGIQLPLSCRVFIKNLAPEVTDNKLREVFSLAGHVVVAKRHLSTGKVLFDHPVEAVQAISMFNGQTLCNSKMIVHLDKSKYTQVLPDGLEAVGEGLGVSGKPLRAVRMIYEMQPLKELLQLELSRLQQPNAGQNDLRSMLSVNTNPAQNNTLISLLQLLQEKVDGGAGNLNLTGYNQSLDQRIFSNSLSQQTPPISRFDIPPNALALAQNPLANMNAMANAAQNPMANMNVMANAAQNPMANLNAMSNAAQNPMANMNAMSNAAQNPMASMNAIANAAQNPMANMNANVGQNTLAHLQTALTNLQNANVGQNQQASRSRFDIPPSALNVAQNTAAMTPNASTSGANPNWGSGQNNWNNQSTSQNQQSGYDNSGYGSYQQNPDEFDVQKRSDLKKEEDSIKSSDMLLFQNLPPSVTSKALVNKMREVGELLFAEMTGQGRAVVRFQDVRDAERCVKLYDRSKVDGQVISVKLF